MKSILWFGDRRCDDPAVVGGKAASLSRLSAMHPVPPGFVVAGTSATAGDLNAAYERLAELCGTGQPAVAVRSSAVDEDGERASFAGQHDTFLNVVGVERLQAAVARCRRSYTTTRAAAYRASRGLGHRAGRVPVLVQQLVVPDVSLVVFTANPATGDRREVVINACWGLGESIVDGTVTPDTYLVRRSDLAVTRRCIADKRQMTVAVPDGTREVAVPEFLRTRPALTARLAVEAARLALRLEATVGGPVDVEGVYRRDRLHLLQCRPITAGVG